jgi:HEAT repeat protein
MRKDYKHHSAWQLLRLLQAPEADDRRIDLLIAYIYKKPGLDYFKALVNGHNNALLKDWTSFEVWWELLRYPGQGELEMTMHVIGTMDTPRATATLFEFAKSTYHPLVRSEALVAMGHLRKNRNLHLIIQQLREPEDAITLYGAVVATDYGSLCDRSRDIRDLVARHLNHPDHNICSRAACSLAQTDRGKRILVDYLSELESVSEEKRDVHRIRNVRSVLAPLDVGRIGT